jgi:hypothetical protein
MQNYFSAPFEMFSDAASLMCKSMRVAPKLSRAALAQTRAAQYYWSGMFKYAAAFMAPSVNALNAFTGAEKEKLAANSPAENLTDYNELSNLNMRLACDMIAGSVKAMNSFFFDTLGKGITAWMNTFENEDCLSDFASRLEEVLKVTVREYPKAVEAVKAEFGFHLDEGGYEKAAETERFDLYRVLPSEKEITPRSKPILIIPPYVMGPNILAFLPAERRSYVHCYANQGIPTYIRLVKDIRTTDAVQAMTGEDDALDIRFFCRELMAKHNRPVTLNGFCQGGLQSIAALLSGELDGLVDAFITCVTPVDGSRSKTLVEYMQGIAPRFRDLKYSQKKLPNGNSVVDGSIMSWVYKLRKLDSESPVASFHRDIAMFDSQPGPHPRISKTAAGIMQWLIHDQVDIPVHITKMSFDSFTIPIDREGNLPITLFGRKLNLKRIEEKKIPWLICIADGDDLVDKEAALAPLDYIDAEVCVFPKGHASLATSWSLPTSECALHLRFRQQAASSDELCKMSRGPVRYQIDLDAALEGAARLGEADEEQTAESKGQIETGEMVGIESASRTEPPAAASSTEKATGRTKAGRAANRLRPAGKTGKPGTK